MNGKETGVLRAALAVAATLAIAACGGDAAPVAPPPPPPVASPPPVAPPPPAEATVTRIGFEDRSTVLLEGGRVRALVMAVGEPVFPEHGPLEERLAFRSDAPGDRLIWTSASRTLGIYALEIESLPDMETNSGATYEFRVEEANGGLPPGIALDQDRTVLRVTVQDLGPEDCSDLALNASRVRRHPLSEQWGSYRIRSRGTARIHFQGPRRAALRILAPYFRPGDGSSLAVLNPTDLPYQGLGGGAHRQTVSLHWLNDLELAAFLPGCEEVLLSE